MGSGGVNEPPGSRESAAGVASYPHPFGAGTTTRFTPTGSASGGVRIFDASGKLRRTVSAAHVAAVVGDGKDRRGQETGPGAYLCRYGSAALAVPRLRQDGLELRPARCGAVPLLGAGSRSGLRGRDYEDLLCLSVDCH